MDEKVGDEIGLFNLIIHPAYTLGGTRCGIVQNLPELLLNIVKSDWTPPQFRQLSL